MTFPATNTPELSRPTQPAASGCMAQLLPILGGLIALISSLTALVSGYGLDQVIFEGSLAIQVTRWQAALFFAGGLSALLAVLFAVSHFTGGKAALRAWLLAAIFGLLIVPARLADVTQAQITAGLQIAGMLLFMAGVWLIFRRNFRNATPSDGAGTPVPAALLSGLLLAVPWVLWGALGSVLDVLLNLMVGLLFGLCAALILQITLYDPQVKAGWHGLTITVVFGIALLVMTAGLAQNNQQFLLGLVIPVMSQAVVTFYRAGQGARGSLWAPAILIGLAVAWPLIWVDADELALIITSGDGELTYWVRNMITVSLAIVLFITLIAPWLMQRLRNAGRARAALPMLVGLVLVFIYFVIGQPGLHGERLFVILKDQANLSSAAAQSEYLARRVHVFDTLTAHADQSQAEIRARLDAFRIAYRPYYLVNALEVEGGPLVRLWLESRPEVDRVIPSPVLRPLPAAIPSASGTASLPKEPQWNLTMIGAEKAHRELSATGVGIIVGQSDSGVQGDHPELADSYRGRDEGDDYNWFDPWYGSTSPVDIGGHGTHTLGSVLGNNTGVAPDAEWIGCVNLGRNLGNPALYLDCMQFMLAPFPQGGNSFTDGDPARGAMVLNNSWGCPEVEGCDPQSLQPAVSALRAAGVFVVVSAGNAGYGGCGSVKDPPAIYEEVYSVGAVDSFGNLVDFSSLGPVTVDGSQRTKPDIIAPGDGVLSAYPNSSYEYASGTSMAGPHVVGVVALMWSANPDLIGDIETTTRILNETAQPVVSVNKCGNATGGKSNATGYGLLSAYEAVRMALDE